MEMNLMEFSKPKCTILFEWVMMIKKMLVDSLVLVQV